MEPWPFDTIPPDQIDALSDAERQVLEAIAQAYLVVGRWGLISAMTKADGLDKAGKG